MKPVKKREEKHGTPLCLGLFCPESNLRGYERSVKNLIIKIIKENVVSVSKETSFNMHDLTKEI
jgi:hypothetical protein